METLAFLITILITFFGFTHFIIMAVFGLLIRIINFDYAFFSLVWIPPVIGLWLAIDYFWVIFLEKPLSIGLIFLCWLAKLIDDWIRQRRAISSGTLRSDTSIHINMAEAWTLFVWGIVSIFLDYRAWF